jgi:hypothetical protein
MLCNDACVPTGEDPNNCGACGNVCPGTLNGSTICSNGVCTSECESGWANCSGKPEGPCDTNLGTDPGNCGACGMACTTGDPNATPTCNGGACGDVCDSGYSTCGGSSCAVDLQNDPNNCGTCGNVCTVLGYYDIPTCTTGVCGFTCPAGTANCGGGYCDDIQDDPDNCGSCGNSCFFLDNCSGGGCCFFC